ncbi:MAG: stage II sporulation protein M [Actinomycetota bacterium]|nr:stage II sporulation protein M [Actinomycetota bacterium]
MDERTFIDGSRETWDRLAELTGAAQRRGVVSLGAEQLRAMYEDYRRTAADLAYAQTHFPGSATEAHLNGLVGSAHAGLYGESPRRIGAAWEFLARGYPRLIRANWRPIGLSALVFGGACVLGFLLVYVNYPLARIFIPEMLRDGVGDTLKQGGSLADVSASLGPLLTAGITANNIQVSLLAFAGGMTFGALTGYALLQNGLMLGALAGVFTQAGGALQFWSLIVPHGALELPAIVLAGGSGLMLARALVAPGDLPRSAALKSASGDAVRVVLGAIPLLVIAGAIEGFLTPAPVDPVLKIAFGAVMALALTLYVVLPGRSQA